MNSKLNTSRRDFLRLGLGGLAVASAAPMLWIPKLSKAGQIPAAKDNYLIVINLDGGARTVPMFNAGVDERWNPYGTQMAAEGTEWAVGGVFSADPFTDAAPVLGFDVPSLPQIADEICVIGTVDHVPGAATGIGNHATARNIIASGREGGGPSLLSMIYHGHGKYNVGVGEPTFPPVVIGTGGATLPFGAPMGSLAPVMVPSFSEFQAQSGDNGGAQPAWARKLEESLDGAAALRRSNRDRELLERIKQGKANVESFKAVFTNPALDVAGSPDAMMNGLSNRQLEAALGTSQLGRDMALALRFIGTGSAAVLVGNNGWDTHSAEMNAYEMSANTLGRVLSGLKIALELMQHPQGGSYWERTLITVTSEFGRDNVMTGGYNSGGGSDHTGGPGSRNQAFPYLGGLVGQKGKQIGHTHPATMEVDDGEPAFATASHMAMMLALLDIDPEPYFPGIEPLSVIF
ncbi:MAG: DUF1501 domain-containing protein [Myxococcales bacterium]|nr:DUF1501 domain-containing protein [Myxococcales bacterium]